MHWPSINICIYLLAQSVFLVLSKQTTVQYNIILNSSLSSYATAIVVLYLRFSVHYAIFLLEMNRSSEAPIVNIRT